MSSSAVRAVSGCGGVTQVMRAMTDNTNYPDTPHKAGVREGTCFSGRVRRAIPGWHVWR